MLKNTSVAVTSDIADQIIPINGMLKNDRKDPDVFTHDQIIPINGMLKNGVLIGIGKYAIK